MINLDTLPVNRETVITVILARCEDPSGFINQLGSHLVFDTSAYEILYSLYKQYIELLGDDELVNRRVARFAVDMVTTIESAMHQLEQHKHEDVVKARQAHAQILDVLYRLLP